MPVENMYVNVFHSIIGIIICERKLEVYKVKMRREHVLACIGCECCTRDNQKLTK